MAFLFIAETGKFTLQSGGFYDATPDKSSLHLTDEAITGTQVTKRENFQRMINDCMDGKIDMIITKSISRFARNTLDTLKYVRMLKERNIAVFFEDENINTMTMDGELLLVILSSVAQQEVENISANVKKGLKMKMKRGELVGFQSCLGYDYDPTDKSISINVAEAIIVQYIYDRYIDGAGAYVIAKELTKLGYKTKYGNTEWHDTAVLGIIKNEKYKGDVLQGKTFTVDPISKRRLDNYGEEDQFYVKNHHEPIVSEEVFEKAQVILSRRGSNRRGVEKGKREKYSRKFSFSSKLECVFCGSNLSRRNWHSGSIHEKVIWQCVTATKKGKKYCLHSKALEETLIENAFVESYKLLCYNNSDVLDELVKKMETVLSGNDFQKRLTKIENEIHALEQKRNRLIDMRLEETIDKAAYEKKYEEFELILGDLSSEKEQLEQSSKEEIDLEKRIEHFRKVLEKNEVLTVFDRCVFESIVEKVIIGEIGEDENPNPYKLTFVYKTGFFNTVQSKMHKQFKKKRRQNDVVDLPSYSMADTCGGGHVVKQKGLKDLGGISMDTKVLQKLLNDYDPNLNIESIDDDMLIISPNEYLTLYATKANEMLVINNSGTHWHMETEMMAGFIIDILKGNSIVIEIRSIFVKVIEAPSRYKILSKEKYEKIKHCYIGKKRVRIYSGNSIIQRAD